MISIAIINRYYPPDSAVTGAAAGELASHLQQALPQAQIRIYAGSSAYRGTAALSSGDTDLRRIRSWYAGSRKLPRLLASLVEGLHLAWLASREADVVISLTDPPLLGLWVGLLRRRRRFRWIEWTMDLYPEAFVAAGLVEPGNPIYRFLRHRTRSARPDCRIALGPRQADFLDTRRGPVPSFLLPCGLGEPPAKVPAPDWRREHPQHLILAYAGNLGEAHSDELLIELVRRADPARFRFLFAPHGAKAGRLRAALAESGQVIWREQVSPADLAHADVHIASLKPQWTHVCVPSKAVSSLCLGRPLLFAGTADSDNWELLQDAAWLIPETAAQGIDGARIEAVLTAIDTPPILAAKTAAAAAVRSGLLRGKADSLRQIAAWIGSP